jgi:hypothetical protein
MDENNTKKLTQARLCVPIIKIVLVLEIIQTIINSPFGNNKIKF